MKELVNMLHKLTGFLSLRRSIDTNLQEEWQGWDAWVSIDRIH
ncbi:MULTISPECIES: hypothetical protein [Marinomonas]|uniref:Uncharacterized protein n=1 Tax=Marinomonas rhodophyticola TaxID=2992803 RepID=A0ABT3KD63_9GAMM|nr:hypothetical protein [Marinomonas sp. KJ51-3]MCW4628429.1 hypothetical protein [Marinomonas sp. KJ51-3]